MLSCFPLHARITVLTSYSMGVEREGGGRRGEREEEERKEEGGEGGRREEREGE